MYPSHYLQLGIAQPCLWHDLVSSEKYVVVIHQLTRTTRTKYQLKVKHTSRLLLLLYLNHSTPKVHWVNSFLRHALGAIIAQSMTRKAVDLDHIILNDLSFKLHSKFWQSFQNWAKSDKQMTLPFWRENTWSVWNELSKLIN